MASVRSCDDGRTAATQRRESHLASGGARSQRTLPKNALPTASPLLVERLTEDKQNALRIVSATYPVGTKPRLTLASRVLLKNYSVDLSSRAPSSIIFFSPTDRPRHQDSKRLTHLIPPFRGYESPVLSKSLHAREVRRQSDRGLARIPWNCRPGLCSHRRSVEQE
jgi:hypothetical protein